LARAVAGQNHFLLGPSDAFHSYFNGNEEHEQRFYSYCYDSYPGSGYWQQFEEMASARQSSLIASGASNNTNASRAKPALPIMGRKSRVSWRAESREHAELNSRIKSSKILN